MKKCVGHSKSFCVACVVQTALFPVEHVVWRFLGPLLHINL